MFAAIRLLLFAICISIAYSTVDVQITYDGGSAVVTGNSHNYGYSFLGIPFAIPPVGDLRFTAAQLKDPTGAINATTFGAECYQYGSGSEDCLFINVYTPINVNASSKLPVFVWAFGGGFTGGNGNMGSGMYTTLINRGPLIVVSFNYRVGPFGFFTTRNPTAPGNGAISDCITALQWVQKYIGFFGGDPSRVTFGGQSSGAEAVSFVSMSPKGNGLYNQLILESGSSFGAAVMSYSDKTRNTSFALSQLLGCVNSLSDWKIANYPQIVSCVRGKSAAEINAANDKLPSHRMPWAPVQDTTILPNRLEYLALNRKNVPVLAGDVHDEWLSWVQDDIANVNNDPRYTKEGVRSTLRNSYEMTYWDNQASVESGAESKYIDTNVNLAADDHVGWMAQDIMLFSEMVFIGPVLRDARYFAYTGSNVYLYSFDYLNPNALPTIQDPRLRGVEHGWELQYIFDTGCNGWTCTSDDELLRTIASTCWSNFIVNGDPTPANGGLKFKWTTLDATNRYLSLTPYPSMQTRFHDNSTYWACTAPTIDGFKPPFSC